MQLMYEIVNDREQRDFIRMNPAWYKELNRDPSSYARFKEELELMKKEVQPSRLEKVDKQINMANVVLKLLKGIG